jgi:para-nitrobenzyl esterase
MSASGRCCGRVSKFSDGFVFGLAALFACLACASSIRASADDPVIRTESGRLQGVVGAQIVEYLGIPYAVPPVGALRWMPPQSFGRWEGIFQATQFGSICPQLDTAGTTVLGDEDCLFLNVYTPHGKIRVKPRGRAVMVWIHGGGLNKGAGSQFDPTPLVDGGDVIVVTINYRLGVLGFLAQSALDSEGHLAGNYGFLDQQFALEWVQRNIEAFGGDPSRVTIFGESAGGLSIYSQLASPLAAGLFQRAIAQSGAYAGFAPDYRVNILPLLTAETTGGGPAVVPGNTLAADVDCADETADCLRAVDAATLINAQGTIFPFLDGAVLTETPGDAFSSGDFNRVPVITGNNHDEYRYFVATDFYFNPAFGPVTVANYPADVTTVFGTTISSSVQSEYPVPAGALDDVPPLQLSAAGTDGIFVCTARRAERSLSQFVNVFAYEFNDENAPVPAPEYATLNFPMGAYHSADVQYLFNRNGVAAPFTPDQQLLSQSMISYWTHFAKKGNPNSMGQPHWERYNSVIDERQSFVPPTPAVESSSDFDSFHMCSSYWDLF